MATFAISDTGNAGTYLWQVNTGSGYANVPASAPYSGVTTKVLTVNPVTATMAGYQYRCIRTSASGCIDTSAMGKLVIGSVGVNVLSKQVVSIVPNPAKNIISVTAPIAIEKIEVFNMIGQKLISEKPGNAIAAINIESLTPGMYILRLNDGYTDRFVKE